MDLQSPSLLIGAVFAAGLCVGALTSAQAAPISGLFNTGLDAGGTVLPNGGLDAHYTVLGSPNAPAVAYTHPAYAANNAGSRWVSTDPNGGDGPTATAFTYRLTFTLAGLDPTTAEIHGLWGVDNQAEIFLNGVNTCQSALKNDPGSASNIGSDAVLVQRASGGADQPSLKQIELSPAVHLPFDQLELGDLALGLTV